MNYKGNNAKCKHKNMNEHILDAEALLSANFLKRKTTLRILHFHLLNRSQERTGGLTERSEISV